MDLTAVNEAYASDDYARIKSIQFGIVSPEDVLSRAVTCVTRQQAYTMQSPLDSATTSGSASSFTSSDDDRGTLYDLRLSASQRSLNKLTKLPYGVDEGNFGYIKLAMPCYHPDFVDTVKKILKVICFQCSSVMVKGGDAFKARLRTVKPQTRLAELIVHNGKKRHKHCSTCGYTRERHCESWHTIDIIKNRERLLALVEVQERNVHAMVGDEPVDDEEEEEEEEEEEVSSSSRITWVAETRERPLDVAFVHRALRKMTSDDVELLGFSYQYSRPEWMMITVLPVCPPTIRPYNMTSDGKTSFDDLTQVLSNIVLRNTQLREALEQRKTRASSDGEKDEAEEERINNAYMVLQSHVAGLIDNKSTKYQVIKSNKTERRLRTMKDIINGKQGIVRCGVQGKRINYAGRTVIAPSADIGLNELGVPMFMAKMLPFPVVVNQYNREYLRKFVANGPTTWPGANEVLLKGSDNTLNLACMTREEREALDIPYGSIVYKHLTDEPVIMNRQPTLHKMGLNCHRARVVHGLCILLSVNATRPYGADFDGDEAHVIVPISVAGNEASELSIMSTQIMSPQGKVVVKTVQDTTLFAYLATSDDDSETCARGYGCASKERDWLYLTDVQDILARCKDLEPAMSIDDAIQEEGKATGRQLMQRILPRTLCSSKELLSQVVDAKSGMLGGTPGRSVIHRLWKRTGHEQAATFINNLAFAALGWFSRKAFSTSLRDFYVAPTHQAQLRALKRTYLSQLLLLQRTFERGGALEYKNVREHLGLGLTGFAKTRYEQLEADIGFLNRKFKDECQSYVMTNVNQREHNGFACMIASGSKGNNTNVASTEAMLGAQDYGNARFRDFYPGRCTAFDIKGDYGAVSRGLIVQSYGEGLQPSSYIRHAAAGLIGIIATSIKTSETGYIQRKFVKFMENFKTCYDGTVRGSNGTIIQFMYNGDCVNSTYAERVPVRLASPDLPTPESVRLRYASSSQQQLKDDPDEVLLLDKLCECWAFVRKAFVGKAFQGSVMTVSTNVRMEHIVSKATAAAFHERGTEKEDNERATMRDLYVAIEELITTKCYYPTFAALSSKQLQLFECVLRETMSPRWLSIARPTKKCLSYVVDFAYSEFHRGLIAPGEAVGIIASQSIGEPATQMTLDTFHAVGSKSRVSMGVPRLKKIMSGNITDTRATLVLQDTYLRNTYDAYDLAHGHFKATVLKDVIASNVCTYYMQSPKDQLPEKIHRIAFQMMTMMDHDSCYAILVTLDVGPLLAIGSTHETLRKKVIEHVEEQHETACVLYETDPTAFGRVFLAVLVPDDATLAQRIGASASSVATYLRYVETELLSTELSGVSGISEVFLDLVRVPSHVSWDGASVVGETKRHVVSAKTDQLLVALLSKEVDQRWSTSSDLDSVNALYGIEAVRSTLMHEFTQVMGSSSTNVDTRHIKLVVDAMTVHGMVQKIGKSGIRRGNTGPISRASFEECAKTFASAATYAEVDDMEGVSANVTFGQCMRQGTNGFRLLVNEEMIQKYATSSSPSLHSQLTTIHDDDSGSASIMDMFTFSL